MPDINISRLEDIANVPESAEADEVQSITLLLLESKAILELRNTRGRVLWATIDKLQQENTELKNTNRWQAAAFATLTILFTLALSYMALAL